MGLVPASMGPPSWALALALAAAPLPASAAPDSREAIEECMRGNLPARSSVQRVILRAHDRVGGVNEVDATVYWQRTDGDLSNVMMRVKAPSDMRGAGLLILQGEKHSDMFMYLPELQRVRRVTGRMLGTSMFGTDFSYAEFERLQGLTRDVRGERLEDGEIDGRPAFVLAYTPDPEAAVHERVVTYVDQETCVPLRVAFFERGDSPRKVLSADPSKIEREGERWVPKRLVMVDRRDETETELLVVQVEFDTRIPRKMFSQRELQAGG